MSNIESNLSKMTFFGKVLGYPNNKIVPLKFLRIYDGGEGLDDIRIEFELKNGLGNVSYHIWNYGKLWSASKKDFVERPQVNDLVFVVDEDSITGYSVIFIGEKSFLIETDVNGDFTDQEELKYEDYGKVWFTDFDSAYRVLEKKTSHDVVIVKEEDELRWYLKEIDIQ